MIYGVIHKGSGLGDQLFTYILTRVIALDKGYEFGFIGKEFFKGKNFLNLDWGGQVNFNYHISEPSGSLVIDDEHFIQTFNEPYYNPEVNFVIKGTGIDATSAQDIRYFGHRLPEIRQWLYTEPIDMSEDTCVINFRGGEFSVFPELFLTRDYWDKAVQMMLDRNPNMQFEVHTDDSLLAKQFFPDFPIATGIEFNWQSVRWAKNVILSNSAFGIIPSLMNEDNYVIAPRFWARRNIRQWSMPSNYYSKFNYI